MDKMTDARAVEVLAAMREDGGAVADADYTAAIDRAVARLREPVGVDGLAGLLEQIRDLLASLPVDCLGTDTAADGQPYPIRDEVIHSITKALAQQPAAVDGACCHSWHDYGQVNRSWCRKCNALAVTGYEDRPYALAVQPEGAAP